MARHSQPDPCRWRVGRELAPALRSASKLPAYGNHSLVSQTSSRVIADGVDPAERNEESTLAPCGHDFFVAFRLAARGAALAACLAAFAPLRALEPNEWQNRQALAVEQAGVLKVALPPATLDLAR